MPGKYVIQSLIYFLIVNCADCFWNLKQNQKNTLPVAFRQDVEKNLKETISTKKDCIVIYHNLMVLLEKTNKSEFVESLQQFLSWLNENGYGEFLSHFQNNYCSRLQQWATWARNRTNVNNMYLESFHRVLKVVYLDSKQNRHVDKLIHTVLKISRDKLMNDLLSLKRGSKHRLCERHKRHRSALRMKMTVSNIGSNLWQIESHRSTYTVSCLLHSCFCNLFCAACIHMYRIVLNSRLGVYFLPEVLDPALIRDRRFIQEPAFITVQDL